uniref:RING-type E3 ubiquitin transferase n=1 Tax=Leersia perrieri TaxID=77586 RepID=A0A0D9VKX7_9ORYZ
MVAAVANSLRSFTSQSTYQPSSSSHDLHTVVRDSSAYTTRPPPQAQSGGGGGNGRISPAVLFIIVILAVIFFISGLLHLLVRLLMKKQHRRGAESSSSPHNRPVGRDAAMDRQLQQLFHLHDSGLDQAFIDALPVFAYRDIVGGDKEPFDCAVCLCEFDGEDRLRLLPVCGHAFHLHCIDTWLLSNSTCPLCRGTLYVPGLTIESLMFDFDERLEQGRLSEECEVQSSRQKPVDEELTVPEKRVFPVRLGKFKNVGNTGVGGVDNGNVAGIVSREPGESSSSSLDARRCFSMGTYQYVLGASELRVALQPGRNKNGVGGRLKGRAAGISSVNAEIMEGKRICAKNKGESFSMSKIWQWSSVKGKLPAGSDNYSETGSFPWMKRDATGDNKVACASVLDRTIFYSLITPYPCSNIGTTGFRSQQSSPRSILPYWMVGDLE